MKYLKSNKNNHNKETIVRYMNKDLGESESFNNLKDVKEHLIKHLSSTLTSGELEEARLNTNAVINKSEAVGNHALFSGLVMGALISPNVEAAIRVFKGDIGYNEIIITVFASSVIGVLLLGFGFYNDSFQEGLRLSYLKLKLEIIEELLEKDIVKKEGE